MSRTEASFSPQTLLQSLSGLPACKRLLVGYSGGADSTALLLALHQLQGQIVPKVEAVHFNHGLQDRADDWQRHCQDFCQQRSIPLRVQQLSIQHNDGSSPETAAREARYQYIEQLLKDGGIYLTAHHADDQAETLFLNLLRGSGSHGLAGIPPLRALSQGWLARPLLNVRRAALESFLGAERADWITDTSNLDQSLDRNYLRGTIFPLLDQRWPGLVKRLNQSSQHLRDQGAAFRLLLSQAPEYLSPDGITLPLDGISPALPVLQAEIIRNWIHEQSASPPPRARLKEFLQQLQDLRSDSQAELRWGCWLIKHHSGQLWMHELPAPAACQPLDWGSSSRLELGSAHGNVLINGKGTELFCGWRVSNRTILSKDPDIPRSEKNKVKDIMRLSGIPVWLRDTVPLLIKENKLCAIGDWWFSPRFKQQLLQAECTYLWQPEHRLLLKLQSLCHNWVVDSEATLV